MTQSTGNLLPSPKLQMAQTTPIAAKVGLPPAATEKIPVNKDV